MFEDSIRIFFWSLLVNTGLFTVISVSTKGNYRERNFAELYVDIDKYIQNHENAFIWRGTAYALCGYLASKPNREAKITSS